MGDLIDAVSFSDIGLTGLVTVAVLLIFLGGLVPVRYYRDAIKRGDKLEAALDHEQEVNRVLANEIAESIKKIYAALPTQPSEREL